MTIIYRESKGAPLTAFEIDGNFRELLQRIESLENLNTIKEQLFEIKQEGDKLIFTSKLGTELGRAHLPTVTMTPRGAWRADVNFMNNDIIYHNQAAYMCLKSHKSHDFNHDQQHWMKIFTAQGTDTSQLTQTFKVPIITQDSLLKPSFGTLAIYTDEDKPELLLGDVNCWRHVSDGKVFNPDEEL